MDRRSKSKSKSPGSVCVDIISEDDPLRKELLWQQREENHILTWVDRAEEKSVRHDQAGKRFKSKHHFFGSLSVLFPIVFSALSQVDLQSELPVTTIGFVVSSLLSATCAFFNFSGLCAQHLEFANRYEEYANQLKTELCKPKSGRIACDVFLARNEMQLNSLNRSAPDL